VPCHSLAVSKHIVQSSVAHVGESWCIVMDVSCKAIHEFNIL